VNNVGVKNVAWRNFRPESFRRWKHSL